MDRQAHPIPPAMRQPVIPGGVEGDAYLRSQRVREQRLAVRYVPPPAVTLKISIQAPWCVVCAVRMGGKWKRRELHFAIEHEARDLVRRLKARSALEVREVALFYEDTRVLA